MKSIVTWLTMAVLLSCIMCGDAISQTPTDSDGKVQTHSANALPAAIPVQRNNENGKSSMSPTTSYVLAAVALAAILFYIYFFMNSKTSLREQWKLITSKRENTNPSLKLHRQLALTSKHSLHVVSWDGEEVLIGCADQSISILLKKKSTKAIGEATSISQIEVADNDKEST